MSEVYNAEAERIKHENIDKTLDEHTRLLELMEVFEWAIMLE